MPQIDIAANMNKPPGRCGICNTTPNDLDGSPKPAIDTHVDVDWGNNLYICAECVDVICELSGRVTEETHQRVKSSLKQLKRDHENLRNKFQKQSADLKKLAEGKKIERRVRRAA